MTFEEILPHLKNGEKVTKKWWRGGWYIQFKDQILFDYSGNTYALDFADLTGDDWKLYEEPIDWDYIIEHKCLCKFWDIDSSIYFLGYLNKIRELDNYKFSMITSENNADSVWFHNCRPVKLDELNFYEDKENE